MTYEIIFSERAYKQLQKQEKEVQVRIVTALERIRIRPSAHLIKLLGDLAYRLRVGEHRVILDLDNKNLRILVLKIGHRSIIYSK